MVSGTVCSTRVGVCALFFVVGGVCLVDWSRCLVRFGGIWVGVGFIIFFDLLNAGSVI